MTRSSVDSESQFHCAYGAPARAHSTLVPLCSGVDMNMPWTGKAAMLGKAADMATVPTGAWRSIEYLLTHPSVIGPLIFPAVP